MELNLRLLSQLLVCSEPRLSVSVSRRHRELSRYRVKVLELLVIAACFPKGGSLGRATLHPLALNLVAFFFLLFIFVVKVKTQNGPCRGLRHPPPLLLEIELQVLEPVIVIVNLELKPVTHLIVALIRVLDRVRLIVALNELENVEVPCNVVVNRSPDALVDILGVLSQRVLAGGCPWADLVVLDAGEQQLFLHAALIVVSFLSQPL